MRYDVVLFDLDGTLAASAPGVLESIRYTLNDMNVQIPDEAVLRSFLGPSMYDSMRRVCGMDDAQAQHAVDVYREHHIKNGGELKATVYAGIPSLLSRLKAQGVYLAIASAKPETSVHTVLEHFGLARFFDAIVGAEPGRTETSKQTLLERALPPRYERAAMVGDRRFDMEAAKALNLTAIGAGWGYGTAEELAQAGADVVAATVKDAARVLLGADAAPVRGCFISIEGLDGSGKTTQMNAIAEHMRSRGYEVMTTREPGGTPISEDIRRIVLDPERMMCAHTEALLYAASRAEHVRDVIEPSLAQGRMVLCDRFVDSSIVYQGAGRELGIEQVTAINRFAIGDTMPDLTVLLVMDAQTAFLRRSSATELDRLERAGEAFFGRVYDAYAKLAVADPERIRCIDAQRDIDAVTRDVIAEIDRLLRAR